MDTTSRFAMTLFDLSLAQLAIIVFAALSVFCLGLAVLFWWGYRFDRCGGACRGSPAKRPSRLPGNGFF